MEPAGLGNNQIDQLGPAWYADQLDEVEFGPNNAIGSAAPLSTADSLTRSTFRIIDC